MEREQKQCRGVVLYQAEDQGGLSMRVLVAIPGRECERCEGEEADCRHCGGTGYEPGV
jgi:hypothetical protein